MNALLWIFAIIGFAVVFGILFLFLKPDNSPHYSSGADGDWERYCDDCKGIYDPKTDRPIKKKNG